MTISQKADTMFKKMIFSAVLAVSPSFSAHAATLDPVQLLQQFNLITTGDVAVNSLHVHGRALIGGSMTGQKVDINNDNIDTIVASDFDDLIVGQATSDTKAHLHNGATASMNGTPGLIEGGSYKTPAAAPENYGAVLSNFATDLANKTATASAVKNKDGNKITFAQAATSGISIYDITAADLLNRDIAMDLNGADNIVINVTGTGTFDLMSNFTGNRDIAKNVIWNFIGFDTVNLYRSIWGQVLAGGSHVYFNADIEGSLFAKTVTAQAQVHVQPLKYTYDSPPVTPVPVPAALPLLLAGFGVLGLMRRRRRV